MDFDFTTETITPDTTNVLTIGGTGGLEFPFGSTAQRPGSPQNGLIRYNSTSGTVECFVSNSWASSMAPIMNQVVVQKNPGAGEYGSIAEACASITGASAVNLWEVLVGPGTYTEPEIVIPEFVNVSGIAEYEIVVQPDSDSHHVFVMSENTSLNFLQITGAGPGFAGIACIDVGNYSLCHKVSLTDCAIGFLISSSTKDSIMYLEYCDALGGTTGISVTSSNGFSQYVNLENFYIYDNPVTGMYIAGPDADVNMQAFGFEGADGTNTGIVIEDGATLAAKAGHVFGWDIGSHQTDNGAPSITNYLGCAFHNNTTWDLYSQHIGNEGLLSGQARKDFVNAIASPAFVSAFSDPGSNSFVQTGTFFMGATQANLTDVTDLIIETPPVGLVTGGALSVSSGRTAAVSAGHGYLRKDGYMTKVEWSSGTILLPAGTLPYIYIDENSTIQYSLSLPNATSTILLGRAGTNASIIYALGSLSTNIENYGNKVEEWLRATVGPVFVSGSIVSENGTTPRAINVTAGNWYYGTQHRFPSAKTAPSITDTYKSGGVLTFATISVIPNDTYDNGTNLVALTTGYFTKHVLYQSGEGAFQSYTLIHGQAEYANLNDALEAPLPSPYLDPGPTPKIAAIIVQQGVNSLSQIVDVRPIFFGATGTGTTGTNIHGDLLGLDADDHPQYLLVDGTRAMAGDLSMGANDITSVGTINGVTIETHASRHQPNGADPIPTGSAVGVSTSTVNGPGTSNSLSRADHTHALFGVQPLDATLTALAAYNTNGLLTQTAADTFTGRTIAGTASRVSVTNGNGVSGNPTIDIDSAYVGQTSITTLGTVSTGTWNGTVVGTTYGGTGLSTIGTALQVLRVNAGGTGLEYATPSSGTVTSVAATQPTAGLTITGSPITTSGTLVFALANDLAAVEGLSTTGLAVRTATDTWTTRSVTGTTNRITVTNGDGVAGNPAVDISASYVGQTSITTLGTIATGTWNGTTVGATFGGTGQTSYAVGDLLYANTTTTLAKLADVATGSALISGGINTAPSWGKIGLTTHVSGILPIANGGTNLSTAPTNGQLLIGNGTGYALSTITQGSGITVTNGAGTITIAAVNSGTVTSVGVSGGTTGLTTSGGPITSSGTITLAGTLVTANGGTGLSSIGTASQILGVNTGATALEYKTVTAGTGITVTPSAGAITIAAVNNGTVTAVAASGGTTGMSFTGSPITTSGTLTLTGTLIAANGGTGLSSLGSASQILGMNTGATALEYKTVTAGAGITVTPSAGALTIAAINSGTVTSVAVSGGTTGLTTSGGPVTSSGTITLAGTLVTANGGTGLNTIGTANQILGVNTGATGLEYKTVTAGTGITVTPSAGSLSIAAINNGTVTSVALALPSIFSVSGSPVTTTGTLTGTLSTQSANTFFVGPVSGGAATPTFRTVGFDELNDVVITTPLTNQVVTYNGTNWVNAGAVGANASGLIGVGQAGAAAWLLVSGTRYQADFAHNLGTTNYTVTVWDTTDNSVVTPQSIVSTNTNTVRVTVTGNTKTLKVVVVANGQSIVAGGSTPSSVITAKDGVTVSAAATKLNFTGQAVGVTDAGSGTTNINIGSRFTFFAASLDTPVNADFAVNSLAPMVTDPTYTSLNVRSFSNATEQGVAYLVSIPSGATTMTVKIRGRSQTAPGVASVVQPRMYFRLLPNNSAVGAWSAAQELANISIPTNANFQYATQTISLATFGLTAGNLYQVEMTRRVTGVTGTNLAANFLMAELTVEFA